jgi:acetylornithine/N-succinyldiaminopimelate aminotransferase
MADALMTTYRRLPVAFTKGRGAWLWDEHGNRFLDAVSGVGVCALGHAHPKVAEAVCKQAQTLLHTSNLYRIPAQEQAADLLCRRAGMERAFFCNSGAEAVEAAIKIARFYGHTRRIALPSIVVAENSFHGRTLATLSATGNRKVQAGFEPLVQGFLRVPLNDTNALHSVAENNRNVVAILLEPIQGEGGVNIADVDYLRNVRAICDENDWLMILDEVQSGLGRTGAWFSYQHYDVCPDVTALAKGLGNGIPVGACLARGKAATLFTPGAHGSTFGGNPLACSAALAVLDVIDHEGLVQRAAQLGAQMISELRSQLAGVDQVRSIRGKGLMIGIELASPCGELVNAAIADGLLINVTAERVVRLLPPLVISDAEAQQIVEGVVKVIKAFSKNR